MPAEFFMYFVQPGDTFIGIASKFRITIQDILRYNVICNPDYIVQGQLLYIPRMQSTQIGSISISQIDLPKSGGTPYYVVQPGDSLWCLARQFNSSIPVLAEANQLQNPNIIFPGQQLLLLSWNPTMEEIANSWLEASTCNADGCGPIDPKVINDVYYTGTFLWEAYGEKAVPDLLNLVKHQSPFVRQYAIIALGRIVTSNLTAIQVLNEIASLSVNQTEASLARYTLKRIALANRYEKRFHVTTEKSLLYQGPDNNSFLVQYPAGPGSQYELPAGSEVEVLRWYNPHLRAQPYVPGQADSKMMVFDLVRVLSTGKIGFLPRLQNGQIKVI